MTDTNAAPLTRTCDRCGAAKATQPTSTGKAKKPSGWQDVRGQTWCKACWRSAYRVAAVTLRVIAPVGAPWDEFGPVAPKSKDVA